MYERIDWDWDNFGLEVDYRGLTEPEVRAEAERWDNIFQDRRLATDEDNQLLQEIAEQLPGDERNDYESAAGMIVHAWLFAADAMMTPEDKTRGQEQEAAAQAGRPGEAAGDPGGHLSHAAADVQSAQGQEKSKKKKSE
jgi:hypothetical protein